ncbi:hypothetical protein MMPV_007189 [Pyropia vietnamensis]
MDLTRPLNDYENFLATSTCTVGLLVRAPHVSTPAGLVAATSAAWRRLRPEYGFLSARLEAITDVTTGAPVMGALGPTYRYQPATAADLERACFVGRALSAAAEGGPTQSLRDRVVALGGTQPDTTRVLAMADVEAWADPTGGGTVAAIVLVLCHACSDAPGALAVGHRYVELLGVEVIAVTAAGSPTRCGADSEGLADGVTAPVVRPPQPLTDVQAGLLAGHPGSPQDTVQLPPALQAYQDALQLESGSGSGSSGSGGGDGGDSSDGGNGVDGGAAPVSLRVLPPITSQGVPREPSPSTMGGNGAMGRIEAHFFELSTVATAALRATCHAAGGTIQGALTVADLLTRTAVSETPLPVRAAATVPVNCRAYTSPPVPPTACVCGSAAATVGVVLMPASPVADAIRDVSVSVRAAVPGQPVDWLWRLLHAPASLPAASLMDSSIGVSPIGTSYAGGAVDVVDTLFFGSSTATPAAAQGTMVHAHTFGGRLHVACNATVPGISRGWATAVAAGLHACLLELGKERSDGTLTLEELRNVAVVAAADASPELMRRGRNQGSA